MMLHQGVADRLHQVMGKLLGTATTLTLDAYMNILLGLLGLSGVVVGFGEGVCESPASQHDVCAKWETKRCLARLVALGEKQSQHRSHVAANVLKKGFRNQSHAP